MSRRSARPSRSRSRLKSPAAPAAALRARYATPPPGSPRRSTTRRQLAAALQQSEVDVPRQVQGVLQRAPRRRRSPWPAPTLASTVTSPPLAPPRKYRRRPCRAPPAPAPARAARPSHGKVLARHVRSFTSRKRWLTAAHLDGHRAAGPLPVRLPVSRHAAHGIRSCSDQ